MPCNSFVIWNPVPPGSRLCARVMDNGDDYIAKVRIVADDGTETSLGTAALLQRTCVNLGNHGYAVHGTIAIGDEAPTVMLEMTVEDVDGKTLFKCAWPFSTANSTSHVIVVIVPA